jgi:hypothetical protein
MKKNCQRRGRREKKSTASKNRRPLKKKAENMSNAIYETVNEVEAVYMKTLFEEQRPDFDGAYIAALNAAHNILNHVPIHDSEPMPGAELIKSRLGECVISVSSYVPRGAAVHVAHKFAVHGARMATVARESADKDLQTSHHKLIDTYGNDQIARDALRDEDVGDFHYDRMDRIAKFDDMMLEHRYLKEVLRDASALEKEANEVLASSARSTEKQNELRREEIESVFSAL